MDWIGAWIRAWIGALGKVSIEKDACFLCGDQWYRHFLQGQGGRHGTLDLLQGTAQTGVPLCACLTLLSCIKVPSKHSEGCTC